MNIHARPLGLFQANCYVITDEAAGHAAVIDPGAPDPWLDQVLDGFRVTHILLTHAHADHIGGLHGLRQATGAPVYMHGAEADWLLSPELNLSAFLGEGGIRTDPPDRLVDHGDTIPFAGADIRVVHTPGHSPGGVSFLISGVCFSGDTLFYRSIGRTDLPGGDSTQLLESIRQHLFSLPGPTRILPGHGPGTTVAEERQHNPFLS